MRRIASHFLYWRQLYRMHYVELNDNGAFVRICPLEGEIAGTEFYDGTLFLLPVGTELSIDNFIASRDYWLTLSDTLEPGTPVQVFRLSGVSLTTPEFGTDHSGCNGHIERL